jgi:hypothetical protein
MKSDREMNKHHRINVWRIANCCPVCGSERDYSPSNPNGIECYCSNDNCCYSELFSNVFIHTYGAKNDAARFEVLDYNNEVRAGWIYHPMEWEMQSMDMCIQKRKEDKKRQKEDKHKIYANLGDGVYCRKTESVIKISNCDGCAFCEEHGIDEEDLEFSKCRYPLT